MTLARRALLAGCGGNVVLFFLSFMSPNVPKRTIKGRLFMFVFSAGSVAS